MAKLPARFKYDEITRTVTVVKKKKGERKPEIVTIQVTVRSTNRSDLDRREINRLIDQVFGADGKEDQVTHESKRHIDKE